MGAKQIGLMLNAISTDTRMMDMELHSITEKMDADAVSEVLGAIERRARSVAESASVIRTECARNRGGLGFVEG